MDNKRPEKKQVESWIAALQDKDGMARKHAREHLVELGEAATPLLVPLLSDHDSQTRWEAAKALGRIADPASVPALVQSLEDRDDDVSWLAAEALSVIGPPAALPLLRTLIEKAGSIKIRQGAHHVLRTLRRTEIGDEVTAVYTALNGGHSDVELVANAERALARLKSSGDQ